MNQAIYAEKVRCENCRKIIESGQTCYILDFPGEVIVCSQNCGHEYINGLVNGRIYNY